MIWRQLGNQCIGLSVRGILYSNRCLHLPVVKNFSNGARVFSTKTESPKDFKPIYRFPFAPMGAALNKVKKLQLLVTGLMIPGSFGLVAADLCASDMPLMVTTASVSVTGFLFLLGQIFSRMIGVVYISPDLQLLKISYIDFWGSRVDLEVPKEDVLPISNSPSYLTDFLYRKVYRYSSEKPFKINLRSENILNSKAFHYVFEYDPDQKS